MTVGGRSLKAAEAAQDVLALAARLKGNMRHDADELKHAMRWSDERFEAALAKLLKAGIAKAAAKKAPKPMRDWANPPLPAARREPARPSFLPSRGVAFRPPAWIRPAAADPKAAVRAEVDADRKGPPSTDALPVVERLGTPDSDVVSLARSLGSFTVTDLFDALMDRGLGRHRIRLNRCVDLMVAAGSVVLDGARRDEPMYRTVEKPRRR